MVFITRKSTFSAAHRLYNPDRSEEWNRKVYGECSHENWHGHNYTLEVTVAGKPDEETGYIVDLADLKSLIEEHVTDKCDHRNLNLDVDFMEGINPSTENLVRAIFHQLENPVKQACPGEGFLYSVRLQETERNSAFYCPFMGPSTEQ